MRFTTIAVASAFLGMVVANPMNVVYETEIVTITSCAPEKPNCPYATHTSSSVEVELPEETEIEEITTTCTEEYELPEETGTPERTVIDPPVYHNHTASTTSTYVLPENTGLPTGTGSSNPPAQNTTVPSIPDIPPPFENAASKMGASFIAIVGVAAFAALA